MSRLFSARVLAALLAIATRPALAGEVRLERIVIDDNFPGAYQVEVADVDGDGKLDIIAVGGGTCAWYKNPSWTKRIVTGPKQSPGIISSATRDIDGDGKAEVAIAYEFAMNEPRKGKLLLATQGKSLEEPWTVRHVDDVGSIHRLRWGTFMDTRRPRVARDSVSFPTRTALAVAPIFGVAAKPPLFQEDAAAAAIYHPPADLESGTWERFPLAKTPVCHAIDVVDRPGGSLILGASNEGVVMLNAIAVVGAAVAIPSTWVAGAPGEAPKKGCSEVHLGKLRNGREFLATVEPWHGTDVAVYIREDPSSSRFGPRAVIDTSMKDGHALWIADLDGDGDDEILAGYRGAGTSVLGFDYNGKTWDRTVVDAKIAAQDLRGGDLDGDGRPDVVAVGGSTRNVVWYRPRK